jgi:uncharacterized protein involved in outer membrane biogenesis
MARVANWRRLRWVRITALVLLAGFAIFTIGGFLGVPLLLHHLVTGSLSASLHRQASVGKIRFNPYKLRLSADALRINERGSQEPFAEIGQLRIKASWSSLYRLAPVIQEVTVDRPLLHAVRTPDQRFNFSDLIEGQSKQPQPQQPSASRLSRFAISNIRVSDGQVRFDDEAFHERHIVERIQVGIPFIANLPADTEIYVQPLVRMVFDGSPFRLAGMTKPFATVPDSILDLKLKNLNLTRVAAYLAHAVPVKITQGTLSTKLQVHFLQPYSGPVVRLAGTIHVDKLEVRDSGNAPLVSLNSATIPLRQVDPLNRVAILGGIGIDGLRSGLTRNRGGKTNFSSLTSSLGGAGPPAGTRQQAAPLHLVVHSFDLSNAEFNVRDNTTASPVMLALKGVHIGFKNFSTDKNARPASFEVQAGIGQGSVKLNGTFDLMHSRVVTTAAVDKIDLVPLQAFAEPFWAGTLASGKLSVQTKMQAELAGGRFQALIRPATVSLDGIDLRAPGGVQQPVQFDHLAVALNQVDLNARRADIKEVRLEKLRLFAQRDRDGTISLSSFLHPAPASQIPATTPAPASDANQGQQPHSAAEVQHQPVISIPEARTNPNPASPGWQYQIGSIAIENVEAEVEDDIGPGPIHIEAAPLNIRLKNVSSDFSKAFEFETDAALKPQGQFKAAGSAAVVPFAAKLHITTNGLDLTPADLFLDERVNAKLTRAALQMEGDVALDRTQDNWRASYRGNATLANVRVYDRITNQKFLHWNALSASQIEAEIGSGRPRVNIAELALSGLRSRLILSSEGKLNLRDLTTKKPRLVSSAPADKAKTVPEKAPGAAGSSGPGQPAVDADITLGRILLRKAKVDYTDNFIKPHYSANLTNLEGTIGGISTGSSRPSQVDLHGEINSIAPIEITGLITPLAPKALVDIKGKADGIELTDLSPYTTKYTGYPITKGTLNFDVHYLLKDERLTATNHLFFSQLTFGDKVQSPSAINLPIALAVDLLKNPQGEIDLTLPVSGSLNDPQFSVGALILKALSNLILKVVTSPFSVLASIGGASHQQLNYVEFPAGQATLTPQSVSRLSTLAKALQQRPALRLSISGRADTGPDRTGLRDAMVEKLIRKQKVRELRAHGESADTSTITLAADEYDKYLKLAYQDADFKKPTNFIGMNKSLPPDQMKKLLLDNTQVSDDDLKELATGRAVAVRNFLRQQIDASRLTVAAPKVEQQAKDKGKGARVEMSLQ